ncbi:MAG: Asp-tRNA(Asn)/Glu-tRNA(Gln) amidotransferase subunit GatC [Clostridiales bacterium]|nr:Asp-tRNA(Asn)/Glu-tRNA(Gln) amidotransferase subunit GatC [Clostridiales bacterium]
MEMQITPELVSYLESLARIELDAAQKEKISGELQEILSYMDLLNELDTADVEPMSHAFPVTNAYREDVVRPSRPTGEILQNAPEQKDGCFLVPKTVES